MNWEIIYHKDGTPAGTVLAHPNVDGVYCAYRAVPVCPGLNWSGTYPDTVSKTSKDRAELIEWVLDKS